MNLILKWRERAKELEKYASPVANVFNECANELEQAQKDDANDLVSPAVAALLSGYTADALGRMIKDKKLHNYGSLRRPLVRKSDLPKKAREDFDANAIAAEARKRRA